MSAVGETSPARAGHRVHKGASIKEKGRRKKSSNRRSNSSNGERAEEGSVFASESDLFFNMTHLPFPGSCTRCMIAPRGNRPLPRPEALRAAGSPPFPEGSAAVRPTGFHIQYTIFPAEDMPHRTRSSPL